MGHPSARIGYSPPKKAHVHRFPSIDSPHMVLLLGKKSSPSANPMLSGLISVKVHPSYKVVHQVVTYIGQQY